MSAARRGRHGSRLNRVYSADYTRRSGARTRRVRGTTHDDEHLRSGDHGGPNQGQGAKEACLGTGHY